MLRFKFHCLISPLCILAMASRQRKFRAVRQILNSKIKSTNDSDDECAADGAMNCVSDDVTIGSNEMEMVHAVARIDNGIPVHFNVDMDESQASDNDQEMHCRNFSDGDDILDWLSTPYESENDVVDFFQNIEVNDIGQYDDDDVDEHDDNAEEHDCVSEHNQLRFSLARWALRRRIRHSTLNELLTVLRQFHQLPKDARTLLKTNIPSIVVHTSEDGYVYFGLKKQLSDTLTYTTPPWLHHNPVIELLLNIDGLPLYKSSNVQFWPILCKLAKPSDYDAIIGACPVFLVALFCGSKKPDSPSALFRLNY